MTQAKVLFTVAEDVKLVQLMSKFSCLYNSKSPLYKNLIVKNNAWEEISEYVERSVEDCKKRWRNIKDTYQKREKKGTGTGSSASTKAKQWPLAAMLTFLGKVDRKHQSTSNIQLDTTNQEDKQLDDAAETDEDTPNSSGKFDATPSYDKSTNLLLQPPNKRQKHNEEIIQLVEEDIRKERHEIVTSLIQNRDDDDVDLFFKSIAMSVKKLRPDLVIEAKMKSLQMLFDLESRNAILNLPPPSSPSLLSSSSSMSPSRTNVKIEYCDHSNDSCTCRL